MKKLILTLFCAGAFSASVYAQRTVLAKEQTARAWIISMGLRNISSQSLNANAMTKAQFKATSYGIPKWVVTKNPHKIVSTKETDAPYSKGNMRSEGYPAWTISKGIHRISN